MPGLKVIQLNQVTAVFLFCTNATSFECQPAGPEFPYCKIYLYKFKNVYLLKGLQSPDYQIWWVQLFKVQNIFVQITHDQYDPLSGLPGGPKCIFCLREAYP